MSDVKIKFFMTMVLGAVIFGLVTVGCKKPKPTVKVDPHSPEAVNNNLQAEQALLSEAFKTNDLLFIHNEMYYIGTLATALSHKLEGEKKQRVDAMLAELKQITEAIDNSAGRRHKDATGANLQNLYAVLKELDAEFKTPTEKK